MTQGVVQLVSVMAVFPKSLWPDHVRRPLLRLFIALLVAPLIVAGLLSLLLFLIEGSTETTRTAVLTATVEHGITLVAVSFGFTWTVGVLGIAALWALEQRGLGAWMVAGLLSGALAGLVLGPTGSPVVLVFAAMGCLLFVLIRAIAGISEASAPGR